MKTSLLALISSLSLLAITGCNKEESAPADQPDDTDSPAQTQTETELGDWTGYVENYAFDDQSDVITVHFDSVSGSAVTGHVTFGARALYAAPTDPDAGYPPSYDPFAYTGTPLSGLEFTMLDGEVDGDRVRFQVDPREMWQSWCELQTPVAFAGGDTYACLPNSETMMGAGSCAVRPDASSAWEPIACAKLWACQSACTCTETACGTTLLGGLQFDVALDGDQADGSVVGLYSDDARNVRLSHE